MTAYQAFCDNKVIRIGRNSSHSPVNFGRRYRPSQDLSFIVEIQTIDLGRRRSRCRDLIVESVVQQTREEDLLKPPMSLDIATPKDCPSRTVEQQQCRDGCGQAGFYMAASHSRANNEH